jgi:L-aminopeptidase/D-esterase-like protein
VATPRSIVDVVGISVGHGTNRTGLTGCTVVLCPDGAVAAVDVRGGAPGTRETDLLAPGRLVQKVNAVLLTGGSAFGLAAADGVVRLLAERGSGFAMGSIRVPIVPAAVIFDLSLGSDRAYPDAELGYRAAVGATRDGCEEGCVGAGTGASVGKVLGIAQATKSGLGTAAIRLAGGVTVGALVVVNALGDVVNPRTGQIVAGSRDPSTGDFVSAVSVLLRGPQPRRDPAALGGQNTTIGVVATDGMLARDDLQRVAALAHDGLARVVRPAHTAFDGDTFFALSTGQSGVAGDAMAIAVAAGEVVATAIVRAVLAATSLGNLPAVSDRSGKT